MGGVPFLSPAHVVLFVGDIQLVVKKTLLEEYSQYIKVMKIHSSKIKLFFVWMLAWRWFIFGILGTILPCGYFYFVDSSEQTIRLAGIALQLLGILTVVEDIHSKHVAFDQPNSLRQWFNRLKSCSLLPQKSKPITVNCKFALGGEINCTTETQFSLESDDLEERVNAVNENMIILNNKFTVIQGKYDNMFLEMHDRLNVESSKRISSNINIKQKFEEISIDSLHIAGTGVAWLISGVILASASNEIFRLIRYFQ